jgi:hypothetical protein
MTIMYSTANQGEITTFTNMEKLVDGGYVAASPGLAVDAIKRQYGEVPDRLGSNCDGLSKLRQAIIDTAGEAHADRIANGLILVASHTHWEPAPIFYSFNQVTQRYCVGPQVGRGPFIATSFVFSSDGPVPYEWADASCGINTCDVEQAHDFVEHLNSHVVNQNWYEEPLLFGVSINHRFKDIFSLATCSTHESPDACDWDIPQALAYISRSTTTNDLKRSVDDQVGWTAHFPPILDAEEMKQMERLEVLLMADTGGDLSELFNDEEAQI